MILTIAELKAQLNLSDDLGGGDDALLNRLIAASQNMTERQLGYLIEATYGGSDQEPIPPALVHAVAMLAAHLYENRETTAIGVSAQIMPYGFDDIVRDFRNWSF